MRRSKITNHLRAFRKRFGLSQAELAELLGCDDATKISHYETFRRIPGLEIALRLSFLFGAKLHELFPSLVQEAEQEVQRRIERAIGRIAKSGTASSAFKAFLSWTRQVHENKERKN